jgi:RNA polymerase-associated protein LEO1
VIRKSKKFNKSDSDGEEENNDDEDEETKKNDIEVFGDELADLSDDEHDDEQAEQQEQAEPEEEAEPEQVIDIEMPRVKADLGKEIHFVKLPNFLSVEPKPFDPETYDDENKTGEPLDDEGNTRVRLKVENTMRWRYEKDAEGNLIKKSNARLVKWSDNSLSMYLGNEIFDVYKTLMAGDHNHLFVRQGSVLHGQTVFKTKLSFRPHSIDSNTHRKMTMSLVDHSSRTKKVKILEVNAKNPDGNRNELVKKEEERTKAAARRQNVIRRQREKSHNKGLSTGYLEDRYSDDDDRAGISLNSIKNKFKKKRSDSKTSLTSSSDESDLERRLNKAKDDDDSELNESDSDERGTSGKKAQKKQKKKKVVSDDDDDE